MNKFRRLVCCLLVLAAMAVTVTAAAAAAADQAQAVARTEVWRAITAARAGSVTVAIADQGQTVYAEGFGMADRLRGMPVDRHTVFNMGSISKVYCAAAIMLLADEGKLALDRPVTAYLPEFAMADERYRNITVRMLLTHASGLPGTIVTGAAGYAYDPGYTGGVLATLAKSRLKHDPGAMAPYCNDGFTLAEMVVARVSGRSYLDFLSERIFRPLSLNRTGPSVGQRGAERNANVARYYSSDGREEPLEVLSVLGAGGLSATAEDLCKFADSFSPGGSHILSPGSLAEMVKPQPSLFSGKLREPALLYGLGWDVTTIRQFASQGLAVIAKSGGTDHYNSMLFTLPERRISVAVIVTGAKGAAEDIARTVLESYLAAKGLFAPAEKPLKPPLAAQPIPADQAGFAGDYSSGSSLLRLQLDLPAGTVKLFVVEGQQAQMVKEWFHHDGYFYDGNDRYYFAAVDGKRYLVARSAIYGDSVVCEQLTPAARPLALSGDYDEKRWLWRNAKAAAGKGIAGAYILTSRLIPALPGYIDFGGPKLVESAVAAGPAIHAMRDLTELILEDRGGLAWVWLTGMLYTPAERAAGLDGPVTQLTIGAEGYNEWRRVAADSVLEFQVPVRGRLLVFDAAGKVLCDSLTEAGKVYAPAGSFVQAAGEAGMAFTVRLASMAGE